MWLPAEVAASSNSNSNVLKDFEDNSFKLKDLKKNPSKSLIPLYRQREGEGYQRYHKANQAAAIRTLKCFASQSAEKQ